MRKLVVKGIVFIVFVFLACHIEIGTWAKDEKKVDILFLHDTHSHLNEFVTMEDGSSQVLGGFAKINTLITKEKETKPHMLLVDAGDFSMGTLIQTVYEKEAAELRMLGALGFDATTLGNHEFDYAGEGLVNMLDSAKASGEKLPALVVSNIDWKTMEENGLTEVQKSLKAAFERYGIRDYIVLEKNGVRIALLGAFGKDSLAYTTDCPLIFSDPVKGIKETVERIQKEEKVDMLVCLSHSGIWEDEKKSEDEILAKAVPELDLIISGHMHTKQDAPIRHGDTYIVSAGEYGKYLGKMTMVLREEGAWDVKEYELLKVDEKIEKDPLIQEKIDSFLELTDEQYLKDFGYVREQILCTNQVAFTESAELYLQHVENPLGSIMADAYTYATPKWSDDSRPVDVTVVPAGIVRDTYVKGDITVEKVFNSFSLGIGADKKPGYPLVSAYLTGKELKIVAEVDASISDFMNTARLYTNGLCWNYNPKRMILNKVTDVYLKDSRGNRVELEEERLYRVVSDYYTAQMLGSITDLSYGLLSVVPKHPDGTPVTDFKDIIIKNDTGELKAWVAIASYMESFEDTDGDGIGNIPSRYASLEGRKVVENSSRLADLLKNPNAYFFLILSLILLLLVLGFIMVIFIVKKVKKYRKRK